MPICPSQEELHQLLLDELADTVRDSVGTHVEVCADCQATLELLTVDPDTARVSQQVNTTESARTGPAVERLIDKLCEQPPTWAYGEAENERPDDARTIRFPGPPTAEAPLGQLGPYRILEQLGEGATGLLFRAVDTKLERVVAIKVLRGELAATEIPRSRLLREAKTAAAIRHPNVVTVYQVGDLPDFPPFIVMEMIDGETLANRLTTWGTIPFRAAARMVRDVALGVGTAHEKGLVHRDIKPSNIMLERASDRVKLTDFGLARSENAESRITMDGTISGTPAYMSPEQISRPQEIDSRSDVYSLGIVLYELLTGEIPFRGVVRMTLLQVLNDDPLPPRQLNDGIPRDLETICLKAISKDPHRRYPSADELAADLDRYLDHRPIHARPITLAGRFSRWCSRNPAIALLSGVIVLLLFVLAIGSTVAAVKLSAAREQAEMAQHDAERQRDVVLTTLDRLIYDVHEELGGEDVEIEEVKESLLTIALDGFRRVAESEGLGGDHDRAAAEAHFRLGAVMSFLDEVEPAEEHLEHAFELVNEQLEDSDDMKLFELKSMIAARLGHVRLQQDDGESAHQLFAEALEVSEHLSAHDPENPEFQLRLARAFLDLAQTTLERESPNQVRTLYRRGFEVWERLVERVPHDLGMRHDLMETYVMVAEMEAEERFTGHAIENLSSAIRHGEFILHARPDEAHIAEQLKRLHEWSDELRESAR